MIIFAQLNQGVDNPEWKGSILAVVFLSGPGIYAFVRWLLDGPRSADPWDKEVERGLESDEAVPLCHRCLTPHSPTADFCPQCGATVGQYTNWLPYSYIFSVGDTLRLGTAGQFHRTTLTVLGFILFALAKYAVFAPLYWILLFQRRSSRPPPPLPAQSLSAP
ncbi:MAG TPA: hypothetical protein VNZ64_10770 [Candidatus Acidoferrum sp.]|jgi:hypothetical protein|nr:hypothetical protein [Candidatus Acidoferrum sp.]